MNWVKSKWKAFRMLLAWKLGSTAIQLYLATLIATNGSSGDPFLQLKTIAHMGALVAALRGIDALLDPVFQQLKPEELKKIANETTTVTESNEKSVSVATTTAEPPVKP